MYEQAKNKDKFQGKNVKGFPTIMFSDVDGTTTEYKGTRTADSFLQFLNEKLGGGVQNATTEGFKNKVIQGYKNPPIVKRLPPNTKLPQLNK
jgi:thioredoxin-related protein